MPKQQIDPEVFTALALDDISNKLSKLLSTNERLTQINERLIQINVENKNANEKLIQINVENKNANEKLIQINTENRNTNEKLVQISNENKITNEKLVLINNENKKVLDNILKEHIDERDECEYHRQTGTATTTFTTINVLTLLGHYVKSYEIYNDGTNNVIVSHNVASNLLPSDINSSNTRLIPILPNSKVLFSYNRRNIRNIYIRTVSGTSPYRLILTW